MRVFLSPLLYVGWVATNHFQRCLQNMLEQHMLPRRMGCLLAKFVNVDQKEK